MIERYSYPEMSRVWSAENKTDQWLRVEIAVCEAWAELGVVPKEALPKIRLAKYDLEQMARFEAETQHDVTAFIRSLSTSLGEESRYIHLGLTSYDVVDTGLALQLKEASDILIEDTVALTRTLEDLALKYKDTVIVGRTHGVHAEPTTFGLKLALWVDEMRRNRQRLEVAKEQVCVGKVSGAVGTHATVPPFVEEYVCGKLGLQVEPVSSQIVHRDRHAHFVTALAIVASSLDKMATEIRGLQRTEVREVEEPFSEGQHGSSAMPHKRNPVLCERICGLARVIRGHTIPAMENIALWHERDISNSSVERIILPQSSILLDYMLRLFTHILQNLRVYPDRMLKNLEATGGLIYSQRVLIALIEKGMAREEAYRIVQDHAMDVWDRGGSFLEVLKADPRVTALVAPRELEELFDYRYYLRYVDTAFERLGLKTGVA